MTRSGESIENAIIINTRSTMEAVERESGIISELFGERNRDWEKTGQALAEIDGRYYDQIEIYLADGSRKVFYFDITEAYIGG